MRNKNFALPLMTFMVALPLLGWGCIKPAPQAVQPQNQVQVPNQPATTQTEPVGTQVTTTTETATTVTPIQDGTAAKPTTKSPTTTIKPKAPVVPVVKKSYVSIQSSAFSPQIIAVSAGDTVVWTNKDSVSHTSKSDGTLLWDSGNISPGASYSHVFSSPGTYRYSCAIHPSMKGTVVVR